MFAIVGSGFGLYAYMPAIVGALGERVAMPSRYRARFDERRELAPYAASIEWCADETAALAQATGVVVAQRPEDQESWIRRGVELRNIERVVLEKPLARTPEAASRAQRALARSGKRFRIGYVFRFTEWGERFLASAKAGACDALSIDWRFHAHHFRHDLANWKRSHAAGGGVVRFYGIQALALLAEAGYDVVDTSRTESRAPDEVERWRARFTGPGLPPCDLNVDSRSDTTGFRVVASTRAGNKVLATSSDPLATSGDQLGTSGQVDHRIGVLGELCRTLEHGQTFPGWYDAVLDLWDEAERVSESVVTSPRLESPEAR